MQKYSEYGTKPRANPFGEDAKWYEPPKSEEPEEKEEVPGTQEELEAVEEAVPEAEIQSLSDFEALAFDLDVDLEEITGDFEVDPNNLPSIEALEEFIAEEDFDPDNLVDPDNPIV
jgi:hypothetical protein